MKCYLEIPGLDMEDQFRDYIREWRNSHEMIVPKACDPEDLSYQAWLGRINAMKDARTCPSGMVTADLYFLMSDSNRIIGAVQIRHSLNDYLFNYGGHIGYGIRPSERRRGYARAMLGLALEKCKELNIRKVLVTCDKKNIASARTIKANKGILENEVKEGSSVKQRYWINI